MNVHRDTIRLVVTPGGELERGNNRHAVGKRSAFWLFVFLGRELQLLALGREEQRTSVAAEQRDCEVFAGG